MLTLEEILSELEKKTKFSRKQLYEKIKNKHEELSGLVSMEGAGHLVARDLGVNLIKARKRELKIKNIVSGMKNVNFKARIIQITEKREFTRKDGSTGRVVNLVLSDGSGEVRLPLWDKQVDMVDDGTINEGDVIEVKDAITRDNVFGGVEIRIPRPARIEKIEDDKSIPFERPTQVSTPDLLERTSIKNVKEGPCEIKGNIVHIFNTNPIFHTCPECKLKVEETEDGYKCSEHGKVKPEANLVISGIVDDGSSSMRTVFFRERAQDLSGMDSSVFLSMSADEASDMIKEKVLGSEVILKGRIQKNKIFDTLELIVDEVEEVDVDKESKKLVDEINKFKSEEN